MTKCIDFTKFINYRSNKSNTNVFSFGNNIDIYNLLISKYEYKKEYDIYNFLK